MNDVQWKAKYSGPGCSGVCICGHSWEDHHLGVVMNVDYMKATGEGYVPQECCFFGSNEDGGLDEDGKEHCFSYRDSSWPDEHN